MSPEGQSRSDCYAELRLDGLYMIKYADRIFFIKYCQSNNIFTIEKIEAFSTASCYDAMLESVYFWHEKRHSQFL